MSEGYCTIIHSFFIFLHDQYFVVVVAKEGESGEYTAIRVGDHLGYGRLITVGRVLYLMLVDINLPKLRIFEHLVNNAQHEQRCHSGGAHCKFVIPHRVTVVFDVQTRRASSGRMRPASGSAARLKTQRSVSNVHIERTLYAKIETMSRRVNTYSRRIYANLSCKPRTSTYAAPFLNGAFHSTNGL